MASLSYLYLLIIFGCNCWKCHGTKTIGTLQAASAPEYFLSVFADESESFVAGLHKSSISSAQLWVYDDVTGHITARGLELALTADNLDVILSDVVEITDDDLSSQRWDITINQHIILLHNGKSLYFSTAKEGIPVRLTGTSATNLNQVWIFGATLAPTLAPTFKPTVVHIPKQKHHKKQEGSGWGKILLLLLLPILFGLSLFTCWKYRIFIRELLEKIMTPNPPPPPPPKSSRNKSSSRKTKKQSRKSSLDSSNPFGGDEEEDEEDDDDDGATAHGGYRIAGGEVEMAEFPGGEGDTSEDDDTAPLVSGDSCDSIGSILFIYIYIFPPSKPHTHAYLSQMFSNVFKYLCLMQTITL
jgi:hypothetical protein